MAVKEGKWRCEYCGAVNLGREMNCTSCQAVRGKNVKFFLDDDAVEIQDEQLQNIAEGGADWHCGFCGTDNRSHEASCSQCGAPREGMKDRDTGFTPVTPGSPEETDKDEKQKKKKGLKVILLSTAIVAVALTVFLIFGLPSKSKSELTYTGANWTRTVIIEEQQWKTKTAWEDKVPSGAEFLESWEEQRKTEKVQVGTEKVKTGTKDLGNGFFEDVYEEKPVYENQPVMDTMVRYRILEWEPGRSVQTEGSQSDPLKWPEPVLGERERAGKRDESFTLNFMGDYDEDNPGEEPAFYITGKEKEYRKFEMGKSYQAAIKVKSGEITRFLRD